MDELIESLISDRDAFNKYVYSSLEDARSEIKKRSTSEALKQQVADFLPGGAPEKLKDKKVGVLFRQLASPNYEARRFVSIIDALDDLELLFWEYHSDKFTSNNECKHALGKMHFFLGRGKKGGQIVNRTNVIDFNTHNGNKISGVETIWGENFVDFHHSLFDKSFSSRLSNDSFFDASEWFSKNGGTAKDYYKYFLSLFIENGILFENFMLDHKELSFTKEIFLPAFIEVTEHFKCKPLIVALAPTDIEGDNFWMCYPPDIEGHVKNKLNLV